MAAKTRPAAVRGALQGLGPGGQWSDQLEGREGHQGQDGQERAVEVAGVGGVDPERQRPPAGEPRQGRGQAQTDAGGARPVASRGAHAAIRYGDALDLLGGASHDGELGRTLHQVDHRRRQLAAGRRLARLLARASLPVSHGTRVADTTRATSSTAPAPGSRIHMTATVPLPTRVATAKGWMTRSTTSCSESTSSTTRATRSPRRKSGNPAGATRSSCS